ncbi:heme exporter protein CcmD [Umboniibacter marinipuniceus]|uniref:Heme exporter protein D n=1 Tax=Umboniibacter marinipuniceus TaxID=569599 RepID=A0A3M0A9T6_9GAMM|nr:heme exporter protein CcmD [Umboniibacter marinipuniceus]RMA81297.1 heme exporter protein D [Umboniibacter marinipuniceus]
MYFESWQAFISMGGHGPFVWAAYGITFLTLLFLIWQPSAQTKALRKAVTNEARIQQRRKEQRNASGS